MDVRSIELDGPLAYGVVLGLSLIDGVVPLLPARTAVIGLGVVAGAGDHRAYPLLVIATLGAFASDLVAYWMGRRYGTRAIGWLTRGSRGRRLVAWTRRVIRRHGFTLISLARVVPGGPTPITMAAGATRFPAARFRLAAAIGACLWSAYAFGVGMAGSSLMSDPLLALLVAVVIAVGLNVMLTVSFRRRRVAP